MLPSLAKKPSKKVSEFNRNLIDKKLDSQKSEDFESGPLPAVQSRTDLLN